ncbi:MAG: hypothetical protein JXA42_14505 [Anaerolineales bacterium]|nr:hypothetical protein [Anaerolineales bacterium]
MNADETYENYPKRIVLLSAGVGLAIYGLGAFILWRISPWLAVAYLLFCVWIESTIMRKSCVHCYYYGKLCGMGKGRMCRWLFKPGEPHKFSDREVSWREVIPDMLVLAIPLVGGVITLIVSFSWVYLGCLLLLILFATGGNAVVRGSHVCKHCQQRVLGCPAEKLFAGKEKE